MKILFFSLILLFQGCVNLPPCEDTSHLSKGESAKIVVYRQAKFIGFAATQEIGIDNCYLGTLKNGGFLAYNVNPGRHNVLLFNDIAQKLYELPVDTQSGEVVFIKYDSNITDVMVVGSVGVTSGNEGLLQVTKMQAESELEKLRIFNKGNHEDQN